MSNTIKGKEYALKDIFSKEFQFNIPAYQRPYAWTDEQVLELFDDLYNFYSMENNDNYFLGSIILIKDEIDNNTDVVDGQQRLTTLSILISLLANRLENSQVKEDCINYLKQKGNRIENIPSRPRLTLRQKDQPFFESYIQDVRINELMKISPKLLTTESQRLIQTNAILLENQIIEKFQSEESLLEFIKFLMNKCFLVTVQTSNQDFAFRIFSIMNDRGLDLLPTDIIKADVIGGIDKAKQDEYTEIWESLEDLIGRNNFNEVFIHIRTIFKKTKPQKSWVEEFKEAILSKYEPDYIIDNIIAPYIDAYSIIKNEDYRSTHNAEKINYYLRLLNLIGHSDWIPVVMYFLAQDHSSDYFLIFLEKIERLAAYLFITGKTLDQRTNRYREILIEMEEKPDYGFENPLNKLELTKSEIENFKNILDGEIGNLILKKLKYLILRLEFFIDPNFTNELNIPVSIDKVLPENLVNGSEWYEIWPDFEERSNWINRLSNLAPVSKRVTKKNKEKNFSEKKSFYDSSQDKSPFQLTDQILKEEIWTKNTLENRQKHLLNILSNGWNFTNSRIEKENYSTKNSVDETTFYIENRSNIAQVKKVNDKWKVLKGSELYIPIQRNSSDRFYEKRNELILKGIIQKSNNKWILMETLEFNSPSGASTFILARASSGPEDLKTRDGISYKELQQKPLNESALKTPIEKVIKEKLYYLKLGKLKAVGKLEKDRFILLKDSQLNPEGKIFTPYNRTLRRELKEEGLIIKNGDELLLNKSISFNNPNLAANFVTGIKGIAMKDWKDENGSSLEL